jgi:hypothetical protein
LRKPPGCPGAFAPPVSPTISTRVAPDTHPPAPADRRPSYLGSARHPVRLGRLPGSPRAVFLGCGEKANFQVALNLGSLTVRRFPFVSGCPELLFPRLTRICIPGLPRFRIYGWVDDVSLAESNFASPARAVDESSAPIRSTTFLIRCRHTHCPNLSTQSRQADLAFPDRNRSMHLSPVGAAVPINYRVTS